jgi:hypothetical protein
MKPGMVGKIDVNQLRICEWVGARTQEVQEEGGFEE